MFDLRKELKNLVDDPDQFTLGAVSDLTDRALIRIKELESLGSRQNERAEKIIIQIDILSKQNKILKDGLEQLSKLGNGDKSGNSTGNTLAQKTIQSAEKIK